MHGTEGRTGRRRRRSGRIGGGTGQLRISVSRGRASSSKTTEVFSPQVLFTGAHRYPTVNTANGCSSIPHPFHLGQQGLEFHYLPELRLEAEKGGSALPLLLSDHGLLILPVGRQLSLSRGQRDDVRKGISLPNKLRAQLQSELQKMGRNRNRNRRSWPLLRAGGPDSPSPPPTTKT